MAAFRWDSLATELALTVLAVVLLLVDIAITDRGRKVWVGYAAIVGLLLCLVPASHGVSTPSLFGGLYRPDAFHAYFKLLFVILGLVVTILSLDYLEHIRLDRGVYFSLIVFGVLAMVLLAGANDLVMIYLTFEYLSLSSYVLVGFLLGRDKSALAEIKRSAEASLKYLIYGSVASAVMLYGFSLLYGLAGTTFLPDIARAYNGPGNEMVKLLAVVLILVGMGFKLAVVPFHQWAPDVYEGAPTPVVVLLAVGSKGAGFALLARFFLLGLGQGPYASPALDWHGLLALVAVLTMFTGNLLALVQGNVKRMLGYSSVAHAGYMLAALVCNGEGALGVQALLIYLVAYLLMTAGAFAFVVWYQRRSGSERIEDYAGLARRDLGMAVAMVIFMLSLTGIPPTAGFVGKLFILRAAIVDQPHWWLALAIIVNSVISAYYYLNLARLMFFQAPRRELAARPSLPSAALVIVCAVALIGLGVLFSGLIDLAHNPSLPFAPGLGVR